MVIHLALKRAHAPAGEIKQPPSARPGVLSVSKPTSGDTYAQHVGHSTDITEPWLGKRPISIFGATPAENSDEVREEPSLEDKKQLATTTTQKDVYERLAQDQDLTVRLALLQNPYLSGQSWFQNFKKLYQEIAAVRLVLQQAYTGKSLDTVDLKIPLQNFTKSLDEVVLIIAQTDPDHRVRYALALNEHLNDQQRSYFANDRYVPIHRQFGTKPEFVRLADIYRDGVSKLTGAVLTNKTIEDYRRQIQEGLNQLRQTMGDHAYEALLVEIARHQFFDAHFDNSVDENLWELLVADIPLTSNRLIAELFKLDDPAVSLSVLKRKKQLGPQELARVYELGDMKQKAWAILNDNVDPKLVLDFQQRYPRNYDIYLNSPHVVLVFDKALAIVKEKGEDIETKIYQMVAKNKKAPAALLNRIAHEAKKPATKVALLKNPNLPIEARRKLISDRSVLFAVMDKTVLPGFRLTPERRREIFIEEIQDELKGIYFSKNFTEEEKKANEKMITETLRGLIGIMVEALKKNSNQFLIAETKKKFPEFLEVKEEHRLAIIQNILRSPYLLPKFVSEAIDLLTKNKIEIFLAAILDRPVLTPEDLFKIAYFYISKGAAKEALFARPDFTSAILIKCLEQIEAAPEDKKPKDELERAMTWRSNRAKIKIALEVYLTYHRADKVLQNFIETKGLQTGTYLIAHFLSQGVKGWSMPEKVLINASFNLPIVSLPLEKLGVIRKDTYFESFLGALFVRMGQYYFHDSWHWLSWDGKKFESEENRTQEEEMTLKAWASLLKDFGPKRVFDSFAGWKEDALYPILVAFTPGLEPKTYWETYRSLSDRAVGIVGEFAGEVISGESLLPVLIHNPSVPMAILIDMKTKHWRDLNKHQEWAEALYQELAKRGIKDKELANLIRLQKLFASAQEGVGGAIRALEVFYQENPQLVLSYLKYYTDGYTNIPPVLLELGFLPNKNVFQKAFLSFDRTSVALAAQSEALFPEVYLSDYPKEYLPSLLQGKSHFTRSFVLTLLPQLKVSSDNQEQWQHLIASLETIHLVDKSFLEQYFLFSLPIVRNTFARDFVVLDQRLPLLLELLQQMNSNIDNFFPKDPHRFFAQAKRSVIELLLKYSLFASRISFPLKEKELNDWELFLRDGVEGLANKPLLERIRKEVAIGGFFSVFGALGDFEVAFKEEIHKTIYFISLQIKRHLWSVNPKLPLHVGKLEGNGFYHRRDLTGDLSLIGGVTPYGTNLEGVFLAELGHHYADHVIDLEAIFPKYRGQPTLLLSGAEFDDRMALTVVPPTLEDDQKLNHVLAIYGRRDQLYLELGNAVLDFPNREAIRIALSQADLSRVASRREYYLATHALRVLVAEKVRPGFSKTFERILLGEGLAILLADAKFRSLIPQGEQFVRRIHQAQAAVSNLEPSIRQFVEGGVLLATYGNPFPSDSVPLFPIVPDEKDLELKNDYLFLNAQEQHLVAEWLVYYTKRRARELLVEGKMSVQEYIPFVKNMPMALNLHFKTAAEKTPEGYEKSLEVALGFAAPTHFNEVVSFIRNMTPRQLTETIKKSGLPFDDSKKRQKSFRELEVAFAQNSDWSLARLIQELDRNTIVERKKDQPEDQPIPKQPPPLDQPPPRKQVMLSPGI